jgi:hypothetical protein
MSALNGDKSTYHRERKQRVARCRRTRELLKLPPNPNLWILQPAPGHGRSQDEHPTAWRYRSPCPFPMQAKRSERC